MPFILKDISSENDLYGKINDTSRFTTTFTGPWCDNNNVVYNGTTCSQLLVDTSRCIDKNN